MPHQPDPHAPGFVLSVPETDADWTSLSVPVPDEAHAHAFLVQDGNLSVPGGRYGSDTYECAPVAIAVSRIVEDATGSPMTYADLDHAMSLVVNSSDEVASLILAHGPDIGVDPADFLDEYDLQDEDEDA